MKTSNPSSVDIQDVLAEDGEPVYIKMARKVSEWGQQFIGESGFSAVGAVVGLTYPAEFIKIKQYMPNTFFLIPGYGAQGGRGKDLVHFFNEDGLGAIINSSRGIIAAYKQEAYAQFGSQNFAEASRQAVKDMIADIDGALQAAK